MKILMVVTSLAFSTFNTAIASDYRTALADAVVCKGEAVSAVQDLVASGGTYASDYAAAGFGEGTSYKAVVILKNPLVIGGSKARTFVSETESTNFEFSAYTFGQFSGDYRAVVKMLGLLPSKEKECGHFERAISDGTVCPPTIALTPEEGGFLLGCGWCNGG